MKQLIQKIFSKNVSTPVFVGFGTFAIFTFIVIPGLTTSNVILNIISGIVGVFTLVYIFYYIDGNKVYESLIQIEPGETELDYINPEELKVKKKPNPKMFPKGIDLGTGEKFVKTRKKSK